MSIQLSKKQSNLEKRLKLLRYQVYGKSAAPQISASENQNYRRQTEVSTSDIVYLKQDLLKIFFFSTLAIGTQIILYHLLQNHILNFNLF